VRIAKALAGGRRRAKGAVVRAARYDTSATMLDGRTKQAAELVCGEVVVVEAGGLIPCDGTVIDGLAMVDGSAITGESAPVLREPIGDRKRGARRRARRVEPDCHQGALTSASDRAGFSNWSRSFLAAAATAHSWLCVDEGAAAAVGQTVVRARDRGCRVATFLDPSLVQPSRDVGRACKRGSNIDATPGRKRVRAAGLQRSARGLRSGSWLGQFAITVNFLNGSVIVQIDRVPARKYPTFPARRSILSPLSSNRTVAAPSRT